LTAAGRRCLLFRLRAHLQPSKRKGSKLPRLTLLLPLCAAVGLVWTATPAGADKLKDITCDQFLAMDPEQQDNIVYWVEGVAVGASKKEVGAEEVDIGMDAFGRPVAEVVSACAADRKASLWDKVKSKFHKVESKM
jgi:hypothetical protein